jgi:hypothetical protein
MQSRTDVALNTAYAHAMSIAMLKMENLLGLRAKEDLWMFL